MTVGIHNQVDRHVQLRPERRPGRGPSAAPGVPRAARVTGTKAPEPAAVKSARGPQTRRSRPGAFGRGGKGRPGSPRLRVGLPLPSGRWAMVTAGRNLLQQAKRIPQAREASDGARPTMHRRRRPHRRARERHPPVPGEPLEPARWRPHPSADQPWDMLLQGKITQQAEFGRRARRKRRRPGCD